MTGIVCALPGVVKAAAPAVSTILEINYDGAQYQTPYLQYAGADTSNRPIFMFAYRDSVDTYCKAVLIRIDSETSFTLGTVTTINAAATTADTINCCTENPDASQFWVTYAGSDGVQKLVTGTYNKENLTFGTPGTAVSVTASALTSHGRVEYAGNNRVWVASRQSAGQQMRLASRSTNTITIGSTNIPAFAEDSINHIIRGAGYSSASSGIYRYVYNTYGTTYYFGYLNGTSASTETTSTNSGGYSLGQTHVRQTSDLTKWLALGMSGTLGSAGTIYTRAFSVTWPTSGTGAPTVSSGTILSLTDTVTASQANYTWGLAPGFANDESYIIYRKHSDGIFYYRKLTTSSTTITEGSATQLTTQPSNAANNMIASINSASTSLGNFICFIVDNSSSANPNFVIVKPS